MRNRLTAAFGIRFPICSAGMAMIATPPLVAAVSEAGGLGILGTGPAPIEWIREAIRHVRDRTQKPFGVNLIHETTPMGTFCTSDHIDLCIEEAVALVVFFWQIPPADWLRRLQQAGIPVWATVGDEETLHQAVTAAVDGVILQGEEAGGHLRSGGPLRDLLSNARDRYATSLLIAAGGISTALQIQELLGAGADGVCLGTRFVATDEAEAHVDYKQRIVAADSDSTVITTKFGPEWPDVPMRVLRNRASLGSAGSTSIGRTNLFGLEYKMPPCSAVLPTTQTVGDFELMCLAAGKSVGAIDRVAPAAEVVRGLFSGWWNESAADRKRSAVK